MLETYPVLEALILILGSGILGAWISSLLMKGSYKLKLSEQENKLKEKQESHDALFQRFKKLEESSEQFISGSREMESQFNRLNSRFKHTEEEKVLLQTSLKLCREESEDLKNQIATLNRVDSELETMESTFKQTQNDLLRLQDQQDAWINERADLLEQIHGLKAFRNMYQEMQPQFQESREEIDRLRSELSLLQAQHSATEANTATKGFMEEAQDADTEELKKEIQLLTEKNEDYKKRIGLLSPFRAKYEEINQQYIAQQSEITRLGNEVDKLKNISTKAVNSSNDFQAKYEALLAEKEEAPLTLEKVESKEVLKARTEDQNGTHTEKQEVTVEEVAVEKVVEVAPSPASVKTAQDNGIIDFVRIGVASVEEKDDLKKIKGIGPFIEEKLNKLGIFTFKQIANLNAEDEVKVSEAIGSFPGRIKRDTWVEQAASLSESEES